MGCFSQRVSEYLQQNRIGRLATATPDGVPHITAVGYTNDAEQVYICTSTQAKKTRIIRKNSKVAFIVDDAPGSSGWRYVILEGDAKLVEDGGEFEALKRLLFTKYPSLEHSEEWPIEQGGSSFIAIRPSRVLIANLSQ